MKDEAEGDGDARLFQHQHQFRILDRGILVFDNGTSEQFDSRVVEYALDEDEGRAELIWEHHDDPPVHTLALGDVERLENGNTLISWGTVGQVDEITPEGSGSGASTSRSATASAARSGARCSTTRSARSSSRWRGSRGRR